MLIGARRWRALRSWRHSVFLQKVCEASDQLLVASGRQDHPTPMCDGCASVDDQPIKRIWREALEATNARRRRQAGERLRPDDVGGDRHAKQTRNQIADPRRALGSFHATHIHDRAFEPPHRRFDRDLFGRAQIEATSCAEMLRDKFVLLECPDSAATGGASIPQATSMREAGHARCQPPLPAKIRGLVCGKA